jgi:hypothetical protein
MFTEGLIHHFPCSYEWCLVCDLCCFAVLRCVNACDAAVGFVLDTAAAAPYFHTCTAQHDPSLTCIPLLLLPLTSSLLLLLLLLQAASCGNP